MDGAPGRRRVKIRWVPVVGVPAGLAIVSVAADLRLHGKVDVPGLLVVVLTSFLQLTTFSVIFDVALARRASSAWTFVLTSAAAIGIGVVFTGVGAALELVTVVDEHGVVCKGLGWALLGGAFEGLAVLFLWAMAVVLPFSVRDANERARESDRLRTIAELERLRSHLQPHFVLNTLNTVAGLVVEDPHEARNLIGALGDLLRDSVDQATDEMQTLGDEVQWLRRYAGILETRHRGSLHFVWNIADDTQGVRVPRLLLQPLLENAVKHGALRRREGGEVRVHTSLDAEGRVCCVVEDNGPGLGSRAARPGALGIQIVTRRLALQYKGAASFRLETIAGITRSVVELPAGGVS